MSKFCNFIGKWELIPTENKYQIGIPPKEGIYNMSLVKNDILRLDMDWVDEDDKKHTAVYFYKTDGEIGEYEEYDAVEYIKTTLLTNDKLELCIYKNGFKIAYNTRQVIENGKKLLVEQNVMIPDGGKFTNKLTYIRVS